MKKTTDISKFDLGWQVKRIELKQMGNVQSKILEACQYLDKHRNRADLERVANYLEGLSMAYTKKPHPYARIKAAYGAVITTPVTNDNPCVTSDYTRYNRRSLHLLALDLFARTKKWALKGYIHNEQVEFLGNLLAYLEYSTTPANAVTPTYGERLTHLSLLLESATLIPNTHKFFF